MEDTTPSCLPPVQVLSMADDLQAADAMRKLQRNAAAANHQRMMGGGGGGGGGIDQGPPGGVGGWRAGPGHMGPGAGHGAGTAGMQADMQRRMSNLSGEQYLRWSAHGGARAHHSFCTFAQTPFLGPAPERWCLV